VANKETSAESRAAPTPVTVKDGSKQPKAATLDVKAAATKSGALESAKPTPPTIAPSKAETNDMSRKGDNRILRAAVSMRGTKESSSSSKSRGPTSDDGGKSLRVTTKTAKVKWKRKVAVLKPKSSFASLVV
jgi:hypothetical protein